MDTNQPTPEQVLAAIEWLLSDEADDALDEAADEEIEWHRSQVQEDDRIALGKAIGPRLIDRLFSEKTPSPGVSRGP